MYKYVITSAPFPVLTITYSNEHHNVKEKRVSFSCDEDARRYVYLDMRNWLADNLKRYINHAAILSDVGYQAFYKTIDRCAALEHCKTFLPQLNTAGLLQISAWILENEHQMQLILPNPKHKSYKNSEMKVKELVWLSVQLRKIQRQEKQSA